MEALIICLCSLVVAIHDYKTHVLPHWLMAICITIGILMTGYWNYAIALFLLSGLFCDTRNAEKEGVPKAIAAGLIKKRGLWALGDSKLFAMYGAFLGLNGLIVLCLTALIVVFRRRQRVGSGAVAPLTLLPLVCVLLIRTIGVAP